MILLAVDTSSAVLSVALKKNNEAILEQSVEGFPASAENLMPLIAGFLKKKRLRIEDVDAFLIDRGPGSFTGLRIGFATLKGFLAIDKKKCCGALSLDLISENAKTEKPWLAVALDARRGKIYFRLYRRRKERWAPFQKPRTVAFEEMKKILPEQTAILGDALVKYRGLFEAEMQNKSLACLPEKSWHPKAYTLISFFLNKDPRLVPLKTPKDFLPLYFRLSEAEERRKDYARAH